MALGLNLERAAVRVPASTSNLGAGFDAIGLALNRHLRAVYEPTAEPLRLERGGELAGLESPADQDLVVSSFRSALGRAGVENVTGILRVESEIPVARGLGSSAAAIVAGLRLAELALARRGGAGADDGDVLREAERREGHADNVAAALFGGLVAVARAADGHARAFRLPLSESLSFAFAAPGTGQSTAAARAALPASVPHHAAADALGRLAALLHGLATGEPELLRLGFTDRLHVPYRLPLIPSGAAAVEAALSAGAWAATISGSGTGIIAVSAPEIAEDVSEAMADAFRAAGQERGVAFVASPDVEGAVEQVGAFG